MVALLPYLASFVAGDRFLPLWLTHRGHRLAFSNGIIVLTVGSIALLVFTGSDVERLVGLLCHPGSAPGS